MIHGFELRESDQHDHLPVNPTPSQYLRRALHFRRTPTVVGVPVVYACRLGSARGGQTLVNQPAYEQLLENFSEFIDFSETEIVFKHEGAMVVYSVVRDEKTFDELFPEWHPMNPCNLMETQEETQTTAENPPLDVEK